MEWLLFSLIGVFVLKHLSAGAVAGSVALPRPRSPIGSPTARTPTSNIASTLPGSPRPLTTPTLRAPTDLISVDTAVAQAQAAYTRAYGAPMSAAQLDALRRAANAAGLQSYGGKVSQAEVTRFLNSAAALAAVRPPDTVAAPGVTRTVIQRTADGLPSVVQTIDPSQPDVVGVTVIDYAPPAPAARGPAGPTDLISIDTAVAQAQSAYQAHFGSPLSNAQLAALRVAANANGVAEYGGQVSQAAVTAFLNSPAALAAVS